MSAFEAFFLPIDVGARFCLLHKADTTPVRGAVLFVHAFAEEMNRCRRMAALQARAFARAGWTVLQMDLYGCGDSEGDFGQATWQRWVSDVLQGAAWLRSQSGFEPMLWSVRAGCLLAAEAAHRMNPVPDLVLWQPALSGEHVLQQMLRLQVVRQTLKGGAEPTRSVGLRERLARGESIEVGGYTIGAELASGLESARLDLALDACVAWFEIAGENDTTISPAAERHLAALSPGRPRMHTHVVQGAAFWQTQETTECRALIDATLSAVARWS